MADGAKRLLVLLLLGRWAAEGTEESSYRQVSLRCGADNMQVDVVTAGDFDGVIYTRGSYHQREAPCFLDAREGRQFSLRFSLQECSTKQDGDVYSNVLVLQNDDELIMPGDAAFELECDFSAPREWTVGADLAPERPAVNSRISIVDADPAGESAPRRQRSTVASGSDFVYLERPRRDPDNSKDEL